MPKTQPRQKRDVAAGSGLYVRCSNTTGPIRFRTACLVLHPQNYTYAPVVRIAVSLVQHEPDQIEACHQILPRSDRDLSGNKYTTIHKAVITSPAPLPRQDTIPSFRTATPSNDRQTSSDSDSQLISRSAHILSDQGPIYVFVYI